MYIYLSFLFSVLDYGSLFIYGKFEKNVQNDMRKDIENIQSKLRIISTIFHSSYG